MRNLLSDQPGLQKKPTLRLIVEVLEDRNAPSSIIELCHDVRHELRPDVRHELRPDVLTRAVAHINLVGGGIWNPSVNPSADARQWNAIVHHFRDSVDACFEARAAIKLKTHREEA